MERTPYSNLLLPKTYIKGQKERIIDTLQENFIIIDNQLSSVNGKVESINIPELPITTVGAQDGYVLTYDVSTGKFIPKPKPAGTGFTEFYKPVNGRTFSCNYNKTTILYP